jgi:hypothetical protein
MHAEHADNSEANELSGPVIPGLTDADRSSWPALTSARAMSRPYRDLVLLAARSPYSTRLGRIPAGYARSSNAWRMALNRADSSACSACIIFLHLR